MRNLRYLTIFVFICLLSPRFLWAQFGFEYSNTIPVQKNGISLLNAWAGGLNYIQISNFDFDFDGEEDLFIFDRSNNNIRIFKNTLVNGIRSYEYVHEANRFFPQGIYSRATLVDYDNDGRKDIFCYGLGGLMVYKNIGNATEGLKWLLVQEIVYSNYNGSLYNLAVTSTDIPAIIDVDGDGDIDVLTFHMGGSHLEYHKNLSMEMYGVPDSFRFVLANECWGKFEENSNDNSILLNSPNYPCVGSVITHPEYPTNENIHFTAVDELEKAYLKHAGSTVLALDYTGNGILDLIMGDISFPNLVYLQNSGTNVNTNSTMINTDMSFPSNSAPAFLPVFPAPFYVDVNFDGKRDLIVGTAARNISKNENSIWYYENTGTDNQPIFTFREKDFLQNTMIDHGRGSVPVLEDVDRDGLKDLLVANFYRVKDDESYESKIALYKNTGTRTEPVYTFVTDDWLNLSQLNLGMRLIPTFGDINGDGNTDLIIGKNDGTLLLFWGTNTSFTINTNEMVDESNVPIRVGSFAHPQLVDLNSDGLLDLVIGNALGKLYYFQNVGTAANPKFRYITNNLGNVNPNTENAFGYSAPHFFTEGGKLHLFLGTDQGQLVYFKDIENNIQNGGEFTLVNPEYLKINTEGYSSFFVDDINNNGLLNMFVGLDLGGILHYEANPDSDLGIINVEEKTDFGINIYPNPSSGIFTFTTANIQIQDYNVYDLMGNLLDTALESANNTVDLESFPVGTYIIQFITDKGVVFKKIIRN